MIWDFLIPLCAVVPILYGAWHGWTYGAPIEFRHLLAHLFALLAAIWCWQTAGHAVADVIKADPRLAVVLSFACVYGVAFALAGFAVGLKGPAYRSVESNHFDQILGALAGIFAGSIVGGSIVLLVTLIVPPNVQLSETALVAREWPARVFRLAENKVAGIPQDSPERAALPEVAFREERADPDAAPNENGMVVMRIIPEIVWK